MEEEIFTTLVLYTIACTTGSLLLAMYFQWAGYLVLKQRQHYQKMVILAFKLLVVCVIFFFFLKQVGQLVRPNQLAFQIGAIAIFWLWVVPYLIGQWIRHHKHRIKYGKGLKINLWVSLFLAITAALMALPVFIVVNLNRF